MTSRIRLRTDDFRLFARLKGWHTNADIARALGVDQASVGRILNGEQAPGERFIAATLTAFPEAGFDRLFEVVDESPDDPDRRRS